jgi:hypothetical protein
MTAWTRNFGPFAAKARVSAQRKDFIGEPSAGNFQTRAIQFGQDSHMLFASSSKSCGVTKGGSHSPPECPAAKDCRLGGAQQLVRPKRLREKCKGTVS